MTWTDLAVGILGEFSEAQHLGKRSSFNLEAWAVARQERVKGYLSAWSDRVKKDPVKLDAYRQRRSEANRRAYLKRTGRAA